MYMVLLFMSAWLYVMTLVYSFVYSFAYIVMYMVFVIYECVVVCNMMNLLYIIIDHLSCYVYKALNIY